MSYFKLQNVCNLIILTSDLSFCENKDNIIYSYPYHPKLSLLSIKDVFISMYGKKHIDIAF